MSEKKKSETEKSETKNWSKNLRPGIPSSDADQQVFLLKFE
jgi:hypothetical protein